MDSPEKAFGPQVAKGSVQVIKRAVLWLAWCLWLSCLSMFHVGRRCSQLAWHNVVHVGRGCSWLAQLRVACEGRLECLWLTWCSVTCVGSISDRLGNEGHVK